MKFSTLTLSLLMAVAWLLPHHSQAAGGIIRNGEVLTIGTSGLQLSIKPLSAADLPELALATKGLKNLILPLEIMGKIQKELRPSTQKQFFRVAKISETEERALVEEYRKIFPELPTSDRFTLFAMTDREKGDTYLLPGFFQLSAGAQRAAVLFDEALQASGLVSSRLNMVELETIMESALACTASCEPLWDELQIKLAVSLDRASSIRIFLTMLQKAAVQDGQNGQLAGIIGKNGDLNYTALLGSELTSMMLANFAQTNKSVSSTLPIEYRESRFADLQEKWPDSRFMRIIMNCPYELSLVKYLFETKEVYSYDMNIKPTDSRVTSITKWSYKDLLVKFSQKTLTYGPEVETYFLDANRSELAAVQAVDVNLATNLRKVYVLRAQSNEGRYSEYQSWIYYYYLFGFALN